MVTETLDKATITPAEIADLTGLSSSTVYSYLDQGLIPSRQVKKNGKYLIGYQQFLQWLNSAPSIPVTQRIRRF